MKSKIKTSKEQYTTTRSQVSIAANYKGTTLIKRTRNTHEQEP